jgi:hypothetical protein
LTADEEQFVLVKIDHESDAQWLSDGQHRYQSFFNTQCIGKSVFDDPNVPDVSYFWIFFSHNPKNYSSGSK